MKLVEQVYQLTRADPIYRDYGYADQTRRASVSIPTNLAEGYGRFSTNKELNRYVAISRGSAFEVRTLLVVGLRIGYLEKCRYGELRALVDLIIRQLSAFSRYLTQSPGRT